MLKNIKIIIINALIFTAIINYSTNLSYYSNNSDLCFLSAESLLDQTNLLQIADEDIIPIDSLEEFWKIERPLVSSGFSYTYVVSNKQNPRQLAVLKLENNHPKSFEFIEIDYSILTALYEDFQLHYPDKKDCIARPIQQGTFDFQNNNVPFGFVAEYIKGKTLHEVIQDNTLSLEDKIRLFIRFLRNLHIIHTLGYLHRDLKPENIMLGQDWHRIVLIDFGSSVKYNAQGQRVLGLDQDEIAFTLHYQCPDFIYTIQSEVFVCGIILSELISGQPRTSLWSCAKEDKMKAIILNALNRELEDRYKTCAQFADDLEELLYAVCPIQDNINTARFAQICA